MQQDVQTHAQFPFTTLCVCMCMEAVYSLSPGPFTLSCFLYCIHTNYLFHRPLTSKRAACNTGSVIDSSSKSKANSNCGRSAAAAVTTAENSGVISQWQSSTTLPEATCRKVKQGRIRAAIKTHTTHTPGQAMQRQPIATVLFSAFCYTESKGCFAYVPAGQLSMRVRD